MPKFMTAYKKIYELVCDGDRIDVASSAQIEITPVEVNGTVYFRIDGLLITPPEYKKLIRDDNGDFGY